MQNIQVGARRGDSIAAPRVWYPYRFCRLMGKVDGKKAVTRRELLTFWRPRAAPGPLRPPGAVAEEALVEICARCGACVAACPADAIFALGVEHGAAAGTPAVDARRQPCVLCVGLQCTHACPSGALHPLDGNAQVAMGTAVVDERRCLTWLGQACDACLAACPIPGAIVAGPDGRVRIAAELCVGCGLCERACPTEPTSIHVVARG
jgi:ferredoxin-type protein NapG